MVSSKVFVIFDVDGTINQTEVYAVKAYRKALEETGKTGFSDQELIERIGAPFEQDVRYFFGENEYWINGIKDSAKTFEGIHQMLEELKEKGYKLAVCSNASNWELDVILKKLEVKDYFDVIQGVTSKNNKKYSLEELLLREKPELAVMVGDRSYDNEAARYNQIPFVGCKYGYGKPEELRECQYTIETVLELPKIIDKIVSIRGGTA